MLPDVGYLRLVDIIGDRDRGIPAILPISRTTWLTGVRSGRYPQGVLISPNCRAWRVEDIRALVAAK